ncbi:YolD-like family protein [Virgibacillus kimchii]
MVNDRGNIKWTSLMLPEHVQLIKEMWEEDDKKEKPILDEQQIEEIIMKLRMALHDNLTVEGSKIF